MSSPEVDHGRAAGPQVKPRLSDRSLVLLTLVLAVAVAVTVLVTLLAWHTPELHPVNVGSVAAT